VVLPASIVRAAPVTKRASSEASYSTALLMSRRSSASTGKLLVKMAPSSSARTGPAGAGCGYTTLVPFWGEFLQPGKCINLRGGAGAGSFAHRVGQSTLTLAG
jgi:hypothetical protein